MTKQKYDLSNPGGQPKDWMQREHEKSLQPGLGFKGHALIWGAVLLCGGTLVGTILWLAGIALR